MAQDNNQPRIRTATLEDADILALYNAKLADETEGIKLDLELVTTGVKTALSDKGFGYYYVIERKEGVVAMLRAGLEWLPFENRYVNWIQSVYVHKDHRRKGYYRMLYNHVKEEAIKQGIDCVRLYAYHTNESAKSTYKNLGMVQTGKIYGIDNAV